MRLFEEYFSRHNLKVPVVHHCQQGAVILRTSDFSVWRNRWLLVTIKWIPDDRHPGSYEINMGSPIIDGYSKSQVFSEWPKVEKKWDEYEDFIFDWIDNLKGVAPVIGQREALIAAWEMFVFAYDGWFLKQNSEVKHHLFNSLDKDNSINTRYTHYQDIALYLTSQHPQVLRTWKYEVLAKIQGYSDWLGRLIKEKCDPESSKSKILLANTT
jgi:hypothetical protein